MADSFGKHEIRKYEWTLRSCCAALALAILGISLGLIAQPLVQRTVDLRKHSVQTQSFLKDRLRIQLKHDELMSRFREVDERRGEIMARIPDQPNESVFLGQITLAAENCGLTVQEFRPGPIKRNERFSEMEIGLSSRGNYKSLCRFLAMVDNLPRYALISDIELDSNGSSDDFPIQMKVRIFFNDADTKIAWQPTDIREISK